MAVGYEHAYTVKFHYQKTHIIFLQSGKRTAVIGQKSISFGNFSPPLSEERFAFLRQMECVCRKNGR